MSIEKYFNNVLNQCDFKIHRSGNDGSFRGGSSVKLNVTCHECGKKVHIQKYCRSKGTGSSGNLHKKSANELPEWVTKKTGVSDNTDIATATMTHNNNNYK